MGLIVFEGICEGVAEARDQMERAKWQKFSLAHSKNNGPCVEGELHDLQGKFMGETVNLEKGKKYKVTIEEIE